MRSLLVIIAYLQNRQAAVIALALFVLFFLHNFSFFRNFIIIFLLEQDVFFRCRNIENMVFIIFLEIFLLLDHFSVILFPRTKIISRCYKISAFQTDFLHQHLPSLQSHSIRRHSSFDSNNEGLNRTRSTGSFRERLFSSGKLDQAETYNVSCS